MRREYVDYINDLPIDIKLAKIEEYPMHWKDSIEILFVLEGELEVGIDSYKNILHKSEIEIINANEVRWMKSSTADNLVLIINIDPDFFKKYYSEAEDILFYTDSEDLNIETQEDDKYQLLRRYLSILLFEEVSKLDEYEDRIQENLIQLLYHLLNNFHYLFYEGENLEEDDVQLERYHRIIRYLNKNYMHKVSLQDIAEKEFLSTQYLSYKIKDTFGLSFNEYLNLIRVRESVKLLLDSDRSISDISETVGFSHGRYFNRHFKIHYDMTPSQFRKEYKADEEEFEKLKKISYIEIDEALEYVSRYLHSYDRYSYDNKIEKLDLDLMKKPVSKFKKPSLINLGNAIFLLEEENQRLLEEMQKEIKFQYGLLSNLFSSDMNIYIGKDNKFINWSRVDYVISLLIKLEIQPIIDINNVDKDILDSFVDTFSEKYHKDITSWLDLGFEKTSPIFLDSKVNNIYDEIDMAPFLVNSYINNDRVIMNMVDEIYKDTELSNDTFFGGDGIFTNNGLNKASYYAYLLLSLLGEEVIEQGPGYMVTKSENGYEIIL